MHHFWAFHKQNVWVWYGACFHRQASKRTYVHLSCVQICSLPMPVCDKKVSVPGCNLFMCEICIIFMHVEQICMEFNDWNWLRYNDQCTNLLFKIHRHITGFLINVLYWHTQLTMTQGWKLVWNYAAVAMNILHWLFKSGQTTAKTHWISPWKPTQTISKHMCNWKIWHSLCAPASFNKITTDAIMFTKGVMDMNVATVSSNLKILIHLILTRQ